MQIYRPEVDEESLGGLGAQVPHRGALGADARLEHEVEGEGLGDGVGGVGGGPRPVGHEVRVQVAGTEGIRLALHRASA